MEESSGATRRSGLEQQQHLQCIATASSKPKVSMTSATRRAGQFKCAGAIRKVGFLSVKKWILKRRQSIELARKQGWKRYWVCLRGTALLFHSVIDQKGPNHGQGGANQVDLLTWIQANWGNQIEMVTKLLQSENQKERMSQDAFLANMAHCYIEREPKHLIIIDGAIGQPIPEHPRRDFVFCLSTTFGDAYLFQASCQLESDNWISAIHNACAASIARDLTRDEAIKLFETKIRHLELEAEKKLFLRQRLESRLTSMSSMNSVSKITGDAEDKLGATEEDRMTSMNSLLHRLNQQLLALDSYIEQIHCEVYQLRCYLSSCGAQSVFYQSSAQQRQSPLSPPKSLAHDLPHPKSLLMHVSRPTKLLLIRLGVFTVSSLHAFIHARQQSAETILQRIQQESSQAERPWSPLELRIRSHSISETLLSKTDNAKLENDTEELIEMANLKEIRFQVDKELYKKIRGFDSPGADLAGLESDTSNDRYSIRDKGKLVIINLKANTNSNCLSLVKQLLKIIGPDRPELDFLNYYIRLNVPEPADRQAMGGFYVVKRREILNDWPEFNHVELLEKMIFTVELSRSRIDEMTSPFGILIEGQLIMGKTESSLNVYCSYIEWGSVADKAGLRDEDELLMVDGIAVDDLDMMFIECIIGDASKLALTVRASRNEFHSTNESRKASLWRPRDLDDGDNGDDDDEGPSRRGLRSDVLMDRASRTLPLINQSNIISDEYITSLVCPPPPTQSSAFLRTDPGLLRQKSDIGASIKDQNLDEVNNERGHDSIGFRTSVPRSKSQHRLDNSMLPSSKPESAPPDVQGPSTNNSAELAKQLLKRTERLTELLGKDPIDLSGQGEQTIRGPNSNLVEHLKRSVLELLETEYAYIRHLETINEHYINPLKGSNFLHINALRLLDQSLANLIRFQRGFFEHLTARLLRNDKQFGGGASHLSDDFERLNRIVQQLESLNSIEGFRQVLQALGEVFVAEAEKFKDYANYCIAYSRLQRILHPRGLGGSNLPFSSITSAPVALNTFSSSLIANVSASLQQRDFTRPMGSLMTSFDVNELTAMNQLKQLTEFLSNLDSSSSSVSASLPEKSSASEVQQNKEQQAKVSKSSSKNSGSSTGSAFQRSVHQQNFESYLIKPIQRIVKYPMLLGSIVSSARMFSHEQSLNDLQAATRQMESVIVHVNDSQRIHDEYGQIFEHIEHQYLDQVSADASKNTCTSSYGPHQPAISLNLSQLLYFGPVGWLNTNDFTSKPKKNANLSQMLFVFRSCVVFICKEQIRSSRSKKSAALTGSSNISVQQSASIGGSLALKLLQKSTFSKDVSEVVRYQTLIPVSEVQVRSAQEDLSSKGGNEIKTNKPIGNKKEIFKWELFQCSRSNSKFILLSESSCKYHNNGKVFLLASETNEERNAFLRKIRYIIRESVRNMSLPLARSPSSKSLTPKKFSSPSSNSSRTNSNSTCSQSASLSPQSKQCHFDQQHKPTSDSVKCGLDQDEIGKSTEFGTRIEVNN